MKFFCHLFGRVSVSIKHFRLAPLQRFVLIYFFSLGTRTESPRGGKKIKLQIVHFSFYCKLFGFLNSNFAKTAINVFTTHISPQLDEPKQFKQFGLSHDYLKLSNLDYFSQVSILTGAFCVYYIEHLR